MEAREVHQQGEDQEADSGEAAADSMGHRCRRALELAFMRAAKDCNAVSCPCYVHITGSEHVS